MRDGPSQTRYSKVLINKLMTVSDWRYLGRQIMCCVYSRAQQPRTPDSGASGHREKRPYMRVIPLRAWADIHDVRMSSSSASDE